MSWLNQFFRNYISSKFKRNRDVYRKSKLLVSAALAVIIFSFAYIPIYFIANYTIAVAICLFGILNGIIILWIFKKWGNFKITVDIFFFNLNLYFIAFTLTSGGMYSPLLPWLVTLPMMGFLIVNQKMGNFWSLISITQILVLFVLSLLDIHFPNNFNKNWSEIIHFVAFFGLILYVIVVIWVYENGREASIRQLKKAKEQIVRKNRAISVQHNLLEVQNEKMLQLNNQLEETVIERTEKLSKINDELGAFLYRSSHDLRRPMMSILGLIDLMKLETENEENLELFSKIEYTALNADKMLKKLIMVSDIHHETSALVKINFEEMLKRIEERLHPLIVENNIQFTYQISTHLEFYSSSNLFESILLNLIENSIVFFDEQKNNPSVNVIINKLHKSIEVIVEDNGIGIPDEIKTKVFRMFFKGSTISTGSGLGLHIVKKAAEKLEAKIHLQSEEGVGTSIKITFDNPFA